ncbi:MAG: hypothetical protein KF712_17995 [Akkermansiaceae bacterium]|nr:hypothetical protein [Akkermansiaceae bacterium]
MKQGSNQEASVKLEIRTGQGNRGDLPFSLARFQMIHGGVIHGRVMLLPTEEPDRWEIVLPLVLENGDTPERWLGVLGEFLAGEGFEVELPDFP